MWGSTRLWVCLVRASCNNDRADRNGCWKPCPHEIDEVQKVERVLRRLRPISEQCLEP